MHSYYYEQIHSRRYNVMKHDFGLKTRIYGLLETICKSKF